MPGKNHLGMITVKPEDREDSGVKGMKWGVRRSSTQLKVAAAKRGPSPDDKAAVTKTEGPESSTQRYARLKAQAKTGQGNAIEDADLKFFNARTEALAKVAKLNETNPGWLSKTTKSVLQTAAQKQMQAIADGIAGKYISTPVINALKDNTAAIKAESKTPINYVGKRKAQK